MSASFVHLFIYYQSVCVCVCLALTISVLFLTVLHAFSFTIFRICRFSSLFLIICSASISVISSVQCACWCLFHVTNFFLLLFKQSETKEKNEWAHESEQESVCILWNEKQKKKERNWAQFHAFDMAHLICWHLLSIFLFHSSFFSFRLLYIYIPNFPKIFRKWLYKINPKKLSENDTTDAYSTRSNSILLHTHTHTHTWFYECNSKWCLCLTLNEKLIRTILIVVFINIQHQHQHIYTNFPASKWTPTKIL